MADAFFTVTEEKLTSFITWARTGKKWL